MTDLQGALGCVQMDRAQWILAERARRAQIYNDMLADVEWLDTPVVAEGYVHGYQAYVCLFRPTEPSLDNAGHLHRRRNDLMMDLEERGVSTRQGTHAPVIQGYYAEKYGLRPEQFPKAYMADRLTLTLPLYAQMTDAEQAFVCKTLREGLRA
jgi:perosamine synthetase